VTIILGSAVKESQVAQMAESAQDFRFLRAILAPSEVNEKRKSQSDFSHLRRLANRNC
jgi:hypothetical protein